MSCGYEPTEILDKEEYEKTSVLAFSMRCGQEGCIYLLYMVDYTQDEIYIKLRRIIDSQYTFHDVSDKHWKNLVKSMCS